MYHLRCRNLLGSRRLIRCPLLSPAGPLPNPDRFPELPEPQPLLPRSEPARFPTLRRLPPRRRLRPRWLRAVRSSLRSARNGLQLRVPGLGGSSGAVQVGRSTAATVIGCAVAMPTPTPMAAPTPRVSAVAPASSRCPVRLCMVGFRMGSGWCGGGLLVVVGAGG